MSAAPARSRPIARALLAVVLAAFVVPVLFGGRVVYPHDNRLEVGLAEVEDEHRHNRKFSDQSRAYVPELHEHLRGDGSHWISTWTPHSQLCLLYTSPSPRDED